MTKSKKNRINKDRTKVTDSAPKTRKFVECNCLLHCGGGKSLTESDANESLTEDDDEASEVSEDDDRSLSEDEILIKQFTAPDFDDYDYESDLRNLDININFNDSWILLWIFKYQARFRLPDVAIDKLIKFFKIVLSDADKRRFEKFLTLFYLAKKLLKIVSNDL
ncbi:hypothetical protein RhiirA5_379552 [Rhizophagus irregularis]|uniref:Uncharacterized protein n=1 Tax=Rhizophagus irregularis TaxID=588596 RepID=A0A2N0PBK9_9GLOM|nr:hypothetical protein RhiirA5_379552 [Rhizophagus irregularis]